MLKTSICPAETWGTHEHRIQVLKPRCEYLLAAESEVLCTAYNHISGCAEQ